MKTMYKVYEIVLDKLDKKEFNVPTNGAEEFALKLSLLKKGFDLVHEDNEYFLKSHSITAVMGSMKEAVSFIKDDTIRTYKIVEGKLTIEDAKQILDPNVVVQVSASVVDEYDKQLANLIKKLGNEQTK